MRCDRAIILGVKVGSVLLLCAVAFWAGVGFYAAKSITGVYRSESRFAQIECLLKNYHQQHGTFPPTKYQAAPNGPVHSWRVLLLPYVDMNAEKLCRAYDFAQPWNSPKNRAAVESLHRFAQGFSIDGNHTANYLGIGPGDRWPSQKPLRARLISEGEDRFLLVEDPDSTILWMQPEY